MDTEITDHTATTGGLVFYDGACPLCCKTAHRFRRSLARRGFGLRSLQSPGAALQLGLNERDLFREMRLLLADGRCLGGADAVLEIARRIWWAFPLWLLGRLPGARPILRATYRSIAERRHCVGGVCQIAGRRARHHWVPLVLLPAIVLLFRSTLAPWVFMWGMAFAIYAGFKWFTYRDVLAQRLAVPLSTRMFYLLCWPGMSLSDFAASPVAKKCPSRFPTWLAAVTKTLVGAGLVWVVAPTIPADRWLLRGWVGMVGIILMLHFGTFHLLALALQALGYKAQSNMQAPLLARSLADFWGNRWNTAFNVLAERYGFRLLTPRLGARVALAVVFLVSGLLHEVVITLPARGGYGLPTAYFALQAAGIFLERLPCFRRRPWLKRLFAWVVLVAPLGWLFPPVFVHNVILPMLHAIGATETMP